MTSVTLENTVGGMHHSCPPEVWPFLSRSPRSGSIGTCWRLSNLVSVTPAFGLGGIDWLREGVYRNECDPSRQEQTVLELKSFVLEAVPGLPGIQAVRNGSGSRFCLWCSCSFCFSLLSAWASSSFRLVHGTLNHASTVSASSWSFLR